MWVLLFCHFHSRSGPHRLERYVWFFLYTGVTVTTKIYVVSFIGFHPTNTHLEGGNYYSDKSLFLLKCLHIAVILTLNTLKRPAHRGEHTAESTPRRAHRGDSSKMRSKRYHINRILSGLLYRQRGGDQLCVVSLTKLTSVLYYKTTLLYFPYYINSTHERFNRKRSS